MNEEESWQERGMHALRWLGLNEWSLLLALAVIVAGVWGFAELADEVLEQEQDITQFDRHLLLSLREADDPSDPIGSHRVEVAVRDVTALGSGVILGFVTLVTVVFLLIRSDYRTAVILTAAVAGGGILSSLLKDAFERPRPDLVPLEMQVTTLSFPSGHAMASAATYLALAALLAEEERSRMLSVFWVAVALFLTVAIGFSRVYLGVHWPTDVLAGWAGGAAWALLVWGVARWLRVRQRAG